MFYIEPHLAESEQKALKHAQDFNHDLKLEDPDAKSKTIKNTHLATYNKIVRAYFKFQQALNRCQVSVPDISFRLNNQALATMNLHSRTTTWRHIKRLTEAGMITSKTNHGTNSGYEIELNPDLLVVSPESISRYRSKLIELRKIELNTLELPDEELEKCLSAKLSFSDYPNGVVSFCNDIESEKILQDHNINMGYKVSVENAQKSVQNHVKSAQCVSTDDYAIPADIAPEHFLQEHGNRDPRKINSPAHPVKSPDGPKGKLEQKVPGGAGGAGESTKSLIMYVELCWNFAFSVLFSRFTLTPDEIGQAKKFIAMYFAPTKESPNPEYASRMGRFCERILLARKFINRSPERFIPNPVTWFDPRFAGGFAGTNKWYKTTVEQRKRRADYYGNLKLLAKLYRLYAKDPSYENYRKATQILGKKKDEDLLDLFNLCVTNGANFCPEVFQKFTIKAA